MYKILWNKEAVEELKAISKIIASQLVEKANDFLAANPIDVGTPLSFNYPGIYKYRYEDYHIIYEVLDTKKIVMIIRIGQLNKID